MVIALAGWFQPAGAADTVPEANLDDYQKLVAPLFVTILKRMGIETNEFAGFKGGLDRV